MIVPAIRFSGLIRHASARVTACACIGWIIGGIFAPSYRSIAAGQPNLCVSILPQVFAITIDKSLKGAGRIRIFGREAKFSKLLFRDFEIAVQALTYLVPQCDSVFIRFVFLLALSVSDRSHCIQIQFGTSGACSRIRSHRDYGGPGYGLITIGPWSALTFS